MDYCYGIPIAPADKDRFAVGDIVTLATGDGPDMVVLDVCDCGSVDVALYDDGGMQFFTLPDEALIDV